MKTCLICKIKFYKPYKLSNKQWLIRKYCTLICCGKAASKRQIGKRSHNWKGGVTSENKLARVKFQQEMQKEIFKRDDYTCQVCGIRGKILHADHIKSWSKY